MPHPRLTTSPAILKNDKLATVIEERLAILGKTPRRASLDAGLTPDTVAQIISGRRKPRASTLEKLARVLGCELTMDTE